MTRIAFVTDSTCNLPDDLAQEHNITVVPVYVLFGDQSYRDYVDLPPEAFYLRLAEFREAGLGMPTTSQPTPEDFRQAYTALQGQGYTDIISIHVTAKSSGTYMSAELAKSMVAGVNVHVVDSTSTSMHMGFMLLEAIAAVNAGGGVAEALAAIERVKAHSCLYFTVTDLEHLAYSGRTEGHEKATEAALSVKPVIAVTGGIPKAVGTERTQRAALGKVLELTREQMGAANPLRLAVVYGSVSEKAAAWAPEAAAELGFTGEPYQVDFGPGLAVHFGPGLLGVTVQWE
jgi:DegV family protein with EDD domain